MSDNPQDQQDPQTFLDREEKAAEQTEESLDEIKKKYETAEQNAAAYWERLLRMQADLENINRRHKRELDNAHKYSLDRFVAELIPIMDSLELCINSTQSETNQTGLLEGVNLTLKMFYTAMEKFGISQVNPIDQLFDPEHHQAISAEVHKDMSAGMVISVLQKGYLLNGRLVRPALVTVTKQE